jgi:pimeloyl-ACP methyl ester carboxylesterase
MPLTGQWKCVVCLAVSIVLMFLTFPAKADSCPAPTNLGPSPTRLIVVIPATSQGPREWESFLAALKREPRSQQIAWLVYRHGITYTTRGTARNIATAIASCIDEKVRAHGYQTVTLIGHSVGGMLVRNAYLVGAGEMPEQKASPDPWTRKVDRIILFSSVNNGVSGTNFGWWFDPVAWLGRTIPHPHLVVEDFQVGSDFIADSRIAWIRHFGALQALAADDPNTQIPLVVQFWGTQDSVVTEHDNADLEAFSGPVLIRVPGASHRNLQRLETEYTVRAD